MKTMSPEMQSERIQLVNRYFTAFALALVGIGIALSQPTAPLAYFCLGLLVFTGMFNHSTARAARRRPELGELLSNLRLTVNLAANCLLVYFLGGYWNPIWLLFVLTPVASGIYSSRARTWTVSLLVGGLLLGAQAARGLNAPVDWAQAAVQAAFIVFLGLFVNRLTELVHIQESR